MLKCFYDYKTKVSQKKFQENSLKKKKSIAHIVNDVDPPEPPRYILVQFDYYDRIRDNGK